MLRAYPDSMSPTILISDDLFLCIQELQVTDFENDYYDSFHCYSEFFEKCCRVEKFIIKSSSVFLNTVLVEVLPFMTQLKAIQLSVELTEERMRIIRTNCPSIEVIERTLQD